MRHIFKFPDIGEGITEGKVLEVYIKKGQEVKEGDSLIKVETDKVVTDIPSPETGSIKNIFVKVGETVEVGEGVVELEIEGEAGEEAEATEEKAEKGEEAKPVEEKGFGVVGVIEDASGDSFLPSTGEGMDEEVSKDEARKHKKALATPVARKMARDLGIDINTVKGTGPGGRVMKADIRKAFEAKQKGGAEGEKVTTTGGERVEKEKGAKGRVEVEELTQLRRTIVKKMTESMFTAPHAVSMEEVEISKLVQLREDKKQTFADKGVKLSYLAFVVKAVTNALKRHKKLNSRLDLDNNRVIYHNYFNIGMAVDTPNGLIVPVIKDADQKSIFELAGEIKDYAERSRERKITLDELKGGTFSITNYGSIAGIYGVPIINYPEVAILGVGRIVQKPAVKDNGVVAGYFLPLSLSIDHRIIDGGDAARFLKDVMEQLADPMTMLMM
jgi:pyruvate dehydrogenase E2 component (dihydrolipoamide acetyltransferase)